MENRFAGFPVVWLQLVDNFKDNHKSCKLNSFPLTEGGKQNKQKVLIINDLQENY